MKNKRISKFIIPIIALISIAGITTFVSACKPSKDDNNISDEDFTVSKINDFDYDNYATSHRPMDFANLNPNSDAVINYFKNNYHQGDLLNTVAKYIHLILEYTQVTTLDNESSTTLNGVINESTSKLIVQYINQKGEGNFALWITLEVYFSLGILWDEIEIPAGSLLDIVIHNNSTHLFNFSSIYHINQSDVSKNIYEGNNAKFTIPNSQDNFYVELQLTLPNQPWYIAYESIKMNWSNVPIVNFEDVKLPPSE